MKRISGTLCFLMVAVSAAAQTTAARLPSKADQELLTALVAREDRRDNSLFSPNSSTLDQADPRRRGLTSSNSYLRAFTVRGLGRLENASLILVIAPILADPSREVRIAAADGIAQASARALPANATATARETSLSAASAARAPLVTRLQVEADPAVRAALLEAIGRLNQGSVEQVKATAQMILPSLSATSVIERRGAIRGLFFLARKREARAAGAIPAEVTDRMFAMLSEPAFADYTPTDRYNIAFALVGAAAVNDTRMAAMFADRDPMVRDRAIAAVPRATDTAAALAIVRRGLSDPAPAVRFRAVSAFSPRLRSTDGCASLMALVGRRTIMPMNSAAPARGIAGDPNMPVALLATDVLSTCRGDSVVVSRFLDSVASTFRGGDDWHLPTHAFVSLAALDARRARALFPRFETAENFFVRMYADTAARLLRDTAALYRLARDAHPNVRSSAIDGLSATVGHAADSTYLSALKSDDNQLLMSASAALKGSTLPESREAAGQAWSRLRSSRRETARDGEQALRALVASFSPSGEVGGVERDQKPLPTFDDLAAFERSEAVIEMADGSTVRMRFHPFDAPTNVARFVRLVKAGTFDGLTFHRVAPFFVVQGPGPNANEYSAPDGPFARDELAVSNVRGTVGLSTRGRDTADGQIYFNTVDNIWLDHEYTVIATVVSGVEVVDRMQEGAKIKRITIAVR